jgi:hypothetical protein
MEEGHTLIQQITGVEGLIRPRLASHSIHKQ